MVILMSFEVGDIIRITDAISSNIPLKYNRCLGIIICVRDFEHSHTVIRSWTGVHHTTWQINERSMERI